MCSEDISSLYYATPLAGALLAVSNTSFILHTSYFIADMEQDDRSLLINSSEADRLAFGSFLHDLLLKYKPLGEGKVANYIPELAKVNPDLFSICVVTVDGQVYEVGDCNHLFTIQSISKVFVYGMALEEHGRDYVLTRVGVEPTGEAFNAIVLDEKSKRPYNPMVNAGAIATTSLMCDSFTRNE